jgi:hypothetical protein
MLDAGVVDEHVDAAVGVAALHQFLDLRRQGQVAAFEVNRDAAVGCELGPQPLDLGRVAESVQHDAAATGCQGAGNAQADAAGRTGDEREFALEHLVSSVWSGEWGC